MGLAWLAAVLQPQDIAPHPNFADDDYDRSGPARLAAVVLGDPWRAFRIAQLVGNQDDDDPVSLAGKCLQSDSIAVSVEKLAHRLTGGPPPEDRALAGGLALIVGTAAAELDDYAACFRVLDAQLQWASEVRGSDDALIRAALLQQKALRLRDAGRSYFSTIVEVTAILSQVDIGRCSPFQTSPGVAWSSRTTLMQIRDSLANAAASLIPPDQSARAEEAGLPTWRELVREPAPSIALHEARNLAETYANYVAGLFAERFRSHSRSIGSPGNPDLFYSVLALELLGHSGVYDGRKEIALLRLVQVASEPAALMDTLRLLRHAVARNELDLVLERLRAAGPLSVLSKDARQILRMRAQPEMLRTVEIRVLGVAADLLAPAEARSALDAVRAVLTAGGPANWPGHWELQIFRTEVAWVAAAALGNACGAAGEVATLLLDQAAKAQPDDQFLDRALLRATAAIEWAEVPEATQRAWLDLFNSQGINLPGTAEVVFARLRQSPPNPTPSSPIAGVTYRLNAAIGGGAVDPELRSDGVPLVRETFGRIRADAARGTYSFTGTNAADVAASLVLFADADELWPELTDFLLDSAVPRQEKTPAFERLVRSDISLPQEIADRFRENSQELLAGASPLTLEPLIAPYPAALRFLAAHGLIDDSEIYSKVAILADSENVDSRREAASTVAALATWAPGTGLLAFALPLARDNDVEIRARAARALALLAGREDALAAVSDQRLGELVSEDGLLVPLYILRALRDIPGGLPRAIRSRIEDLANQHPARSIRIAAKKLLDRTS
jgi:hypothetical protein